ncbi:MAG: hypothetical protein IKM33_00120 [Clostridia bacterium]|nr:hypothetical protein [Clostridia bacterium]
MKPVFAPNYVGAFRSIAACKRSYCVGCGLGDRRGRPIPSTGGHTSPPCGQARVTADRIY